MQELVNIIKWVSPIMTFIIAFVALLVIVTVQDTIAVKTATVYLGACLLQLPLSIAIHTSEERDGYTSALILFVVYLALLATLTALYNGKGYY